MDSTVRNGDLPHDWQQERYDVVDAGNGEIALKSVFWGRYVRMNNPSSMDASALSFSLPCNLKSCNDDGSAWNVAKVVCPEASGVSCPAGQKYTPVAGQCCKECMFTPCKAEGKVGTNECPPGCTAVDTEDECMLAAKAWNKPFDDEPIPAGSPRPTGCFRNRKFKMKFNKINPQGGFKGKYPICKQA